MSNPYLEIMDDPLKRSQQFDMAKWYELYEKLPRSVIESINQKAVWEGMQTFEVALEFRMIPEEFKAEFLACFTLESPA